jgi:hypothetical protein
MKKLLPTALLLICMHWTLFARPAFSAPGPFTTIVPRIGRIHPTDTLAPILTTLVPAPSPNTPVKSPNTSMTSPNTPVMSPNTPVTIRVFNNSSSRGFPNTILEWELLANGTVRQKGSIGQLLIAPQHSALFRLPVKIPPTGEELFLHIRYRTRQQNPPLPGSHTIAEEQLLLRAWSGNDLSIRSAGELSFKDEDGFFTISSPAILLRFNKQTGWLQHYEVKGFRLLEDTLGLRPSFSQDPAPGNNIPGSVMAPVSDTLSEPVSDTSSAPWQEATRSPRLQLFSTSTGSTIVIVRTEYTLPATSCQLHLGYTINAAGEMQIAQSMDADSTRKGWPLPRFGMQWVLPPGPDSITAYGHPPQGTLPASIYRQTIDGQTAAAMPVREPERSPATGIRWWRLTGKDGKGLLITADSSLLTISARHYPGSDPGGGSPMQLNIDYPPFPLPYGNYHYSYKVTPVIPGP